VPRLFSAFGWQLLTGSAAANNRRLAKSESFIENWRRLSPSIVGGGFGAAAKAENPAAMR